MPDTARLHEFLDRLSREAAAATPGSSQAPRSEPTGEIVLSHLMCDATTADAATAFERLRAHFVDFNELRVAFADEITAVVGSTYPRVQDRAERLHATLQSIFEREGMLSLAALQGGEAAQVHEYLSTLPGMVPFTIGRVMLFSFGLPLLPVDESIARLLVENDLVEGAADHPDRNALQEMQASVTASVPDHLVIHLYQALQQ